jgi:hypothetical protein
MFSLAIDAACKGLGVIQYRAVVVEGADAPT